MGRDHLLRCAAWDGDVQRIRELVAQGAQVNRIVVSKMPRVSDGSPLHGAVISGHARAVNTLIELGADPNQRNAMGYTPLAAWYSVKTRHLRRHGKTPADLEESAIDAVLALVQLGGHWGGNHELKHNISQDAPDLMEGLERYLEARRQAFNIQAATPVATNARPKRRF